MVRFRAVRRCRELSHMSLAISYLLDVCSFDSLAKDIGRRLWQTLETSSPNSYKSLITWVDSKWRFEQQEQRSRDASSLDRRQFPQQDSGEAEKVSTQEKSRTYVEFDSCNIDILQQQLFGRPFIMSMSIQGNSPISQVTYSTGST